AMLLLCSSRIMPPPLQPLILCFTHPPPTALYTLSLHDALPISPLGHPCAPGLALRARGERVRVLNLDARSAQDVEPARGFGVRVARPGDDLRHAGGDQGLRARRRAAVVRAGLHRHVERRIPRAFSGRSEPPDLGA